MINVHKQPLSLLRRIAFAIAAAAIVMYGLSISASMWLIGAGGVALFLGMTDYGRQCPLLLSLRNIVASRRENK